MEIKFRAWDKESQQMIYDTTPYARMGKNLVMCVGSRGYNRDNQYNIETNIDCVVPIECVMKYTGLPKDKHGMAIYEGDIFKARNGVVAVVEWDEENGRFLGFTVERERKIVYVGQEPAVEVIGNIHQNHELLKAPIC